MSQTSAPIFLWPGEIERPDPDSYVPPSGAWWAQYMASLAPAIAKGQMSSAAIEELTRSSRRIGALLPNPREWTRPKPWKGLVVGSVQSGKTQSMMGVAAVALDAGYRFIIVLAGLKDDLRTQTGRRFNTQLLLNNDMVPGTQNATTMKGPRGPQGKCRAFAQPYFRDCTDDASLAVVLPTVVKTQPVVLVIKKSPTSLAFARRLLRAVYQRHGFDKVPTLILDDECDEASVPGGSAEEKPVPEGITGLWENMDQLPNVAYVGYTATAAANLLQDPAWPLFPDFVWLLRSPGDEDSDLEYREPAADSWYSGGDCFYEDFGDDAREDSNFLVAATITDDDLAKAPEENQSLADAIRAFFVAGAYRLVLQPGTALAGDAPRPDPHSMMIHTSAVQDDHDTWLAGLLATWGEARTPEGVLTLGPSRLSQDLAEHEGNWKSWFDRFSAARSRIYDDRPRPAPFSQPSWQTVKGRLPEAFAHSRVKVVNSNVGEFLDYDKALAADGRELPPQDVYVIAIGGSRLSRGITVKGLGISYFARWAVNRYEDTLLQMSRWFGYRGPHLEFCRVFLTPDAYRGLREMSENDRRIRRRLAELMRARSSPAEATIVFRASPEVLPTAKLGAGKIRHLAFSPFTHAFTDVRYGTQDATNQDWAEKVANLIQQRTHVRATTDSGTLRGLYTTELTALEVADLLDGIGYETHNPDDDENVHEGRFRKPDRSRPAAIRLQAGSDPYHVASYLRYWHTIDPGNTPVFNVGISQGEMVDHAKPFTFPLVNREVTPEGRVEGSWTGPSSGWPGDFYFDRPPVTQHLGRSERAQGASGLLLLYVIHKAATGKNQKGTPRPYHTPMICISIPAGGPHFTRVVRRGRT